MFEIIAKISLQATFIHLHLEVIDVVVPQTLFLNLQHPNARRPSFQRISVRSLKVDHLRIGGEVMGDEDFDFLGGFDWRNHREGMMRICS